ncbi:unnamed protein product [Discosporangium mesarthrocarpum]
MAEGSKDRVDEDDVCFEPGLFIDEEYESMEFVFDEVVQPLLCSNAASTDFDLTGQVVWPISIYVAWFVARMKKLFAGKRVVELGAGCGLSGLVASQLSKTTVLTDGSEVIVRLLQQNAKAQIDGGLAAGGVEARKLVWGDREEMGSHLEEFGAPDIIIGADVVCWPHFVYPFFQTVSALLRESSNSEAALYLGYVCRATNTTELFYKTAKELGFTIKTLDAEEFLPEFNTEARPENTLTNYKLQLLRLTLDRHSRGALVEEERWCNPSEKEYQAVSCQAAPC